MQSANDALNLLRDNRGEKRAQQQAAQAFLSLFYAQTLATPDIGGDEQEEGSNEQGGGGFATDGGDDDDGGDADMRTEDKGREEVRKGEVAEKLRWARLCVQTLVFCGRESASQN